MTHPPGARLPGRETPQTPCGHASIAALALLALAAPAAARPLAAIKQDGTLRVGLTGDYTPPTTSLRRDGGTFKGADVTMAEDLAKALGVGLTIVPTTWKRPEGRPVADRYDVAMGGVSVTADRAAVADFSVPG